MFYLLNYKSLILFKVSHNQIQPIKQLVIPVRFELTTYGLEDRYSSAELYRHNGAESRIRTHGGFHLVCFQDRCHNPSRPSPHIW